MTHPALAIEGPSGGRFYGWPADPPYTLLVPSVTTILKTVDKGPALMKWAAKLVAEAALDQLDELPELIAQNGRETVRKQLSASPFTARDDAATRGTDVHSIAEVMSDPYGVVPDEMIDERTAPFVPQLRDAFAVLGIEPVHVEATVFSESYGYAGTVDLICRLRNVDGGRGLWLVDHKTSKGIYPEHALQQTAYRMADFVACHDANTGEWWSEPMPDIDHAAALHLRPTGWSLRSLPTPPAAVEAVKAARDLWAWKQDRDAQRITTIKAGKAPKEEVTA